MPKIFVITTMYASDLSEEQKNQAKFINWFYSDKTINFFKALGFPPDSAVPYPASRNDEYDLVERASGAKLPYVGLVGKGQSIRFKFSKILPQLEQGDGERDLIVFFDGDGQIAYDDFGVLGGFIGKLSVCDYVVAKRTNPDGGIGESRFLIERFENLLVTKKFSGAALPDAQCGCWGFKARYLPQISSKLTSADFEIELDLLICFLELGISPSFFSIRIMNAEDGAGTFSEGELRHHKRKLEFMVQRLGLTKNFLMETKKEFELAARRELPAEYSELLENPCICNS